MREWAAKLALALASLLLVALGMELVLRFLLVQGGPPMINLPHDRLGHVLKPNLDFLHLWDARESRSRIRTNALGLRGRELPPKRAGEFRILMLGDSYTFGYGVSDEETFPALLQGELNAEGVDAGQTVVVNAGVSAYGTAQEMVQFETLGLSLLADVVVLNVFLGNDIQENLCIGLISLELLPGPPCFAIENGALRELEIDQGSRNDARAVPSLGQRLRGSIRRSELFEFASQHAGRVLTSNAWLARLLYSLGVEVHPGYLPHIVTGWYTSQYAAPGWELTRALLLRLQGDVVASGARFAIVMIPSRIQVLPGLFELGEVLYARAPDVQKFMKDPGLPQRRMATFASEAGIPVLDLRPVLAAREPVEDLYFPIISHWNADGHRVATQAIAEFLIREGLAARLPAQPETASANPPRR